jgi:hypothetical protein
MTVQQRLTLLTGLLIGCSIALPAGAQTVDDARELYAGAAYAEALEVLDAVEKKTPEVPAMREALQYRALCLLALSRPREAEQTVARLVTKEPMYAPDAIEAPPQLRELFRVVREQKLPSLVREKFAAARQSFARDRTAEAAAEFDAVLTLLDAPEVQSALGSDAVADMRTLASGFRDLAKTPAPAAPAAAAPEPRAMKTGIAAAPNIDATPIQPLPAQAEVYGIDHADVVAPVSVRQAFPPLRPQWNVMSARGLLEVVIDRQGVVEYAAIRRSIHPLYDRILLDEARNWRYTAATRNGAPVRYRKMIEVVVGPPR